MAHSPSKGYPAVASLKASAEKLVMSALLFLLIFVLVISGCSEPLEDGLPGSDSDTITYHATGWKEEWCAACHDDDPSVIKTVSEPRVMV